MEWVEWYNSIENQELTPWHIMTPEEQYNLEMSDKLNLMGYTYKIEANEDRDVFTLTIWNLKWQTVDIEVNGTDTSVQSVNSFIEVALMGHEPLHLWVEDFPGYDKQSLYQFEKEIFNKLETIK